MHNAPYGKNCKQCNDGLVFEVDSSEVVRETNRPVDFLWELSLGAKLGNSRLGYLCSATQT